MLFAFMSFGKPPFEMPSVKEEICRRYFTLENCKTFSWKCPCGKQLVKKEKTGCSNLFAHNSVSHPHQEQERNKQTRLTYNPLQRRVKNIFSWFD